MSLEKEFLAVYDENRNSLEKTHCRGDRLALGEFVVVVGIWICNGQNEIL